MNIRILERDINEADKLYKLICEARGIFFKAEINTIADEEVTKRAESIFWSLSMYQNDVAEMLRVWRNDLKVALETNEENSNNNQQPLQAPPSAPAEAH